VVEETIRTGKDYKIEYRNIWPDGSQHWVDVRARAVRRPDGSIKSLVGVCSDITARKTAEIERENLLKQLATERTALAELTATLEQRVEQRTADLMREVAAREKAQEQLRQAQKMEAVGRLAGGIAHDFNNILGGILGYAEMLVEGLAPGSAQKRYAQNVLTAATRARIFSANSRRMGSSRSEGIDAQLRANRGQRLQQHRAVALVRLGLVAKQRGGRRASRVEDRLEHARRAREVLAVAREDLRARRAALPVLARVSRGAHVGVADALLREALRQSLLRELGAAAPRQLAHVDHCRDRSLV
jgi:signal transduction histidine kinase